VAARCFLLFGAGSIACPVGIGKLAPPGRS